MAAGTGDFNSARQQLNLYRKARGATAEYIEALSWLGRGELAAKQYGAADENAAEVRRLCLDQIMHRKLDADSSLPIALGASIEVHAQVAALQGRRDDAIVFLREEVQRWRGTSILPRIEKNLNLLTLEGKPAPPLAISQSLTGRPLQSLAQHAGHPVLLFFWAHWCSDCKAEIAIIERIQRTYGPRGLVVVAPTQHYGYVAGGTDAPRDVETKYINEVFAQYYAGLGPVEVPVSEANFANYGVSTTPTLVLLDARGIVRLYNPGALTLAQLASKVEELFRR
jgi:thiol-disulfide isomerase/thioredoxin